MLRSLVGSEMCIRDSSDPEELFRDVVEGDDRAVLPDDDEADGHVLHQGCLLYTSDAADDLLCVDLGGRRIIKKKKKREHSTTLQQVQYTKQPILD